MPLTKIQYDVIEGNVVNADTVDGWHASVTGIASTIVTRSETSSISGGQIISSTTTGTAPLTVVSTTKVDNLNVDMIENMHATTTATANTVVARDASGNISTVSSIKPSAQRLVIQDTTGLNMGICEISAGTSAPFGLTLDSQAKFISSRVYNAVWNDIAECMPSDGTVQPGDLVQVDAEFDSYFRVTKLKNPDMYMGICSENPGMVVGYNSEYPNPIFVALKGMIWVWALNNFFQKGQKVYLDKFGNLTTQENRIYIGLVIGVETDRVKLFI